MASDAIETATGGEVAPYRVLARKYRPQSFEALIGQEPMVRTLRNAFAAGRIAQAWMLTGVRGVGKTTTARILARALNYETATVGRPTVAMTEPGVHDQAIMEGRHVDVVEMDAASHTGIDDIREIIAQVRYRPVSARYKVYIIDEVHMLSTQAFNGLLKTLEEPPEHVKFVFATTEIRKVPITVLSRCQRFDLRRVGAAEMIVHLRGVLEQENVEIEEEALRLLARASEGSVRDALSLTDQAIAHGAGLVSAQAVRDMLGLADRARVIDLFEALMRGDAAGAIRELREQYGVGADPVVVLTDLADFTHLVTTLRFVPDAADETSLAPAEATRGRQFAEGLSVRTLSQTWQMLLKAIEEARLAASPLQAAEMALIRIAHAADLPSGEDLVRLVRDASLPLPVLAASASPKPSSSATPPPASASSPAPKSAPSSLGPAAAPVRAREPAAAPTGDYPPLPPLAPTGSGAAAPRLAAAPNLARMLRPAAAESEPVAASLPAPAPAPDVPLTLEALAELARGDSRMRTQIRRYLRPRSIEPGHIEAELAPGAPATFANDLSRRLFEWTGRRTVVSLVTEGGAETLEEREAARRRRLFEEAEADPEVAAVLRAIPGATVKDVRLRGEPEPDEEVEAAAAPALVADGDLPDQIDAEPWDERLADGDPTAADGDPTAADGTGDIYDDRENEDEDG